MRGGLDSNNEAIPRTSVPNSRLRSRPNRWPFSFRWVTWAVQGEYPTGGDPRRLLHSLRAPSSDVAILVAIYPQQQVTPIRITISSIVHSSSLEHCSRSRTVDIFQRYKDRPAAKGANRVQHIMRTQHPGAHQRSSPRAAYFLVVLNTNSLACTVS